MEEEERRAWSRLHDCLEQEDDDLLETKTNPDTIMKLSRRKVHLNEEVPGTGTGVGGEVAPVGDQVLEDGNGNDTDKDEDVKSMTDNVTGFETGQAEKTVDDEK